jgi:hypothetical protein
MHRRKGKYFFFEKKKQKTFDYRRIWGLAGDARPLRQLAKVFWFFFSKKNFLP